MDAKLKNLKVAELKDLLSKAGEKVGAKATKAELVTRVLASPAALAEYAKGHGEAPKAAEVETAPPAAQTAPTTTAPAAQPGPEPEAALASAPKDDDASAAASPVDEELEKRKRRAERFGVPLVESAPAPASGPLSGKRVRKGKAAAAAAAKPAGEDEEKLKTRAERFGTEKSTPAAAEPTGKKRGAAAPVDPEEEERRRKRAERFGLPVQGAKA